MALLSLVLSASAEMVRASLDRAISGPVKSACDSFDAGQPTAFSVGCAVAGLLFLTGIFDNLRRSR